MRQWFLAATACALVLAMPAMAQSGLEGRVGKLESEMRAVQRKVFPGGAAVVEPQITPAAPIADRIGAPSSGVVDDLTQRVVSLERQITTMTGQIEQTQYRLRQMEDQFAAYRTATDARLGEPRAVGDTGGTRGVVVPSAPRGDDTLGARPVPRPAAAKPAADKPATGEPARAGQLSAVERPDTGDAAEDAYTYGYRLWAAKLYPEAATQLKKMVTDHPKHRRASYAQNLLGRSYYDDGKPSLASIAFYDNYKKYPEGDRAPESLYYLGQSLNKLNKPLDACKVYGELTEVYGDKIAAGMKADVARARTAAKCK